MGKTILFFNTVTTLQQEVAKNMHSCAQEVGFGWPDVFIIGMAMLFLLFVVKWTIINGIKGLFHNFTLRTQRKYDIEDQKRKQDIMDEKLKQKRELTDNLLNHLKEKPEFNNKYVEVLEKLIGIANDNNSK